MATFAELSTRYKVDLKSIDLEALVQRQTQFLKYHAEDAQILNEDPARRDRIIAELSYHSNARKEFVAHAAVPVGEDPEPYLRDWEEACAKTPKTFEDRVLRLNYASTALLVHYEYKVTIPMTGHPRMKLEFEKRLSEAYYNWVRDEFAPKFNIELDRSPRTSHVPPTPSFSGSSSSVLNADAIDDSLNSRSTLLNTTFLHQPAAPDTPLGKWEVDSVTETKAGVKFKVMFKDLDDTVSMDLDGLRSLLFRSRVVL